MGIPQASPPDGVVLDVAARRRQGTFLLDVAFASTRRRVVLFGASGAGKTTVLQSVAGFVVPAAGRIEVRGAVLFDSRRRINLPPWRRRTGMVLQSYTLFPHLSVGRNVAYGLAPVWRGRERVRVETLLAAVGLGGFADRRPSQLSGGQRQRVALAQALASDPRLLLLDEPFSAVDAPVRERLRRDLLALVDALDVPLVFVTHDFDEAYLLGETIVVLAGGRVVQSGAPAELVARPRTATVARLVGAANVLSGEVVGCDGGHVTLQAGRLRVRAQPSGARTDGRAVFCLRAEDVRLTAPGPETFGAVVIRVLPRDGVTTVLVDAGGLTVEAAVRRPAPVPEPGSPVGVVVPDGAAQVVEPDGPPEFGT